MTIRSALRPAVLALLLQTASGCSWAFMSKPPAEVQAPNYPVECTSSRAAPVLDTICAGYFVVNTLVLAGATSCNDASPGQSCVDNKAGGLALSAGLAALCAVSAGSGYGYAGKCQSIKNTNALCITGNEDACRKLNSAWTPASRGPAAAPPPAPPAAAPLTPAPAPDSAAPGGGCTKDVDCKGNRVCERGACVEPGAPRAP